MLFEGWWPQNNLVSTSKEDQLLVLHQLLLLIVASHRCSYCLNQGWIQVQRFLNCFCFMDQLGWEGRSGIWCWCTRTFLKVQNQIWNWDQVKFVALFLAKLTAFCAVLCCCCSGVSDCGVPAAWGQVIDLHHGRHGRPVGAKELLMTRWAAALCIFVSTLPRRPLQKET